MSALQKARETLAAARAAHDSGVPAEQVLGEQFTALDSMIRALEDTDRHVPRVIGGQDGLFDVVGGGAPLSLPPDTPTLAKTTTGAQPYDVPLPLKFD